MRLTMREKKKAVVILAPRYQKARKKEKGKMLHEFIALTGYCRTHASYVLSMHGKRKRVSKNTVMQADVRKTGRSGRKKIYTEDVKKPLIKDLVHNGLHLREASCTCHGSNSEETGGF